MATTTVDTGGRPPGEKAGEELRRVREELGLTQVEVAEAWGRPQSNLSRLERDEAGVSPQMKRLILSVMRHLAAEKAREAQS